MTWTRPLSAWVCSSLLPLLVADSMACSPQLTANIAIQTPAPSPTANLEPSPTPAAVATYINPDFRVSLQYPAGWQPDALYGSAGRMPRRYDDQDGFFAVGAMDGPNLTLDQAAESATRHKLKPFGDDPEVTAIWIGGQEARLIVPREPRLNEAALVTRLAIRGGQYNFLWIHADKAHIETIARTIQFLPDSR